MANSCEQGDETSGCIIQREITRPAKGTTASASLLCNVQFEVSDRKVGHKKAPAHWASKLTRR